MDLASAILTGLGLAAAAGLNAYIPLLVVGLVQVFGWVDFPSPYDGLANPWAIGVVAVLLVVEVLADKVPAVDSVNDMIQTFVRPVAGAVLFAGSTGVVSDLPPVVPLIAGLVTAGTVHGAKAAFRPVANASTAGVAAPVVSTAEDVVSFGLTVVAFLAPLLVLVVLALLVWQVVRWRRSRRQTEATAQP